MVARTEREVFQCLEKIERSGLWAAGFVSYEASGAFDEALKTHASGALPFLQFGLFRGVEQVEAPRGDDRTYELGEWIPSVTRDEYLKAIDSVKDHIAAGDTYQVNYTFRLNAEFSGDPFALFCDLTDAQRGGCCAFVDAADVSICSASPELFFELTDGVIAARPMKGTLPRGMTVAADRTAATALASSQKDRAENIMIVDMIRNDIGRIAETGSVSTVRCFDIEKYSTVWQMTSTVVGKTAARLSELWTNLFPCASITGAPKAKTMEIIRDLEPSPRGIYTGSIGFITPEGDACFNVAIRTAVIQNGRAEYGIGGGIVWDSDAESEYEEALSKAAILTRRVPEFQLLETMRWDDEGIFLLERHLTRLSESANYFDFKCDFNDLRERLCGLNFNSPMRIRVLLSCNGEFEIQSFALTELTELTELPASCAMAVAGEPVDSQDVFLYHKTTNRLVYEDAKRNFPAADDVLLYNERGEVTESCIANVVVELDGRCVTPPVHCGLLAGTFRDELLATGAIEEQVVTLDDLQRADAVWLVNSVRKWRRALL